MKKQILRWQNFRTRQGAQENLAKSLYFKDENDYVHFGFGDFSKFIY